MNRIILLSMLVLVMPTVVKADEVDDRLAKQLVEVVKDTKASVWVRIEAAKTLGKLGVTAAAAVPDLAIQLGRFRDDENANLQEAVLFALGQIGHPAKPALPAMTRASGRNIDIDRAVRVSIGQVVNAGDEFDVVALIAQLKNKDETIRLRGVKALARLGPAAKPAINDLIIVLGDIDPEVRRAGVAALRVIQPNEKPSEAVIRVYALDLQDPDEITRLRAARFLGKLGPAAASAIPALEAIIEDPDREVRRAVNEALNKISPP